MTAECTFDLVSIMNIEQQELVTEAAKNTNTSGWDCATAVLLTSGSGPMRQRLDSLTCLQKQAGEDEWSKKTDEEEEKRRPFISSKSGKMQHCCIVQATNNNNFSFVFILLFQFTSLNTVRYLLQDDHTSIKHLTTHKMCIIGKLYLNIDLYNIDKNECFSL